jgi:hypothetical protein
MSHTKPLTVGGIGATPSLDDVVSVARGHLIALDTAGSERIKKESPAPKSFQPEPASEQAAQADSSNSSQSPGPACLTHKQARAVLITRLLTLMNGKSGIRLQLADYLKELLNKDILPVLPAADDLSALTAVADACKGEGSTTAAAAQQSLAAAAEAAGISPPGLSAAERAVLASGASAAAGVGSLVIVSARQLLTAVTAVSALSCEAAGAQVTTRSLVVQMVAQHLAGLFAGACEPPFNAAVCSKPVFLGLKDL